MPRDRRAKQSCPDTCRAADTPVTVKCLLEAIVAISTSKSSGLTHYRRAWKPERHLHGDSATEAFHAIAEVLSGSGTSVYKHGDSATEAFHAIAEVLSGSGTSVYKHGDSATEAFHAIAEVLSGSGTSVYKHGDSATEAFHAIAEVLSGSGTSVYKIDELTKRFREELMARRLREDT
jgi:4-diphosphocytidyl-2C-methyl-D-erythritol kinase